MLSRICFNAGKNATKQAEMYIYIHCNTTLTKLRNVGCWKSMLCTPLRPGKVTVSSSRFASFMAASEPPTKRPKLSESSDTEFVSQISPNHMAALELKVKKLSENATLPVRASAHAAGYDLFAAHDHTIDAHGKALIKTDLSLAIPTGHYGRIAPRSSLAWKNHIDVGAGVIDEDYRGPLGVVLFNHGASIFEVKKGDRIAQLIIEVIAHPTIVEVENLDDTARGAGGFGSTGTGAVSN